MNKLLKKAVACLVFIITAYPAFSQAPDAFREEIMQKYWYYRYRLINDFMIIGEGPGKSLPISTRNHNGTAFNSSQDLRWGDVGVSMGYYLGVLATEYYLLSSLSAEEDKRNLNQTKKELFYALKAIERLDKTYEHELDPGYNTDDRALNGFFMRDDVFPGFICNPDEPGSPVDTNAACIQNYYRLNSRKTAPDSGNKYSEVSKAYSNYVTRFFDHDESFNIMSQDQIVGMYMGLVLVIKFVPVDEYFVKSDGSKFYYNAEAKMHMMRITGYLSNKNFKILFPDFPGFSYWYKNQYRNGQYIGHTSVGAIGGNAQANARGIRAATRVWTGMDFPFGFSLKYGGWEAQEEQYQATRISKFLFPSYNLYMFEVLVAISSGLGENIKHLTDIERSAEHLLITSAPFGFEFLPLLHESLFGRSSKYNYVYEYYHDIARELLNSAPCYGPYNFGPQNWTYLGNAKPSVDEMSNYENVREFRENTTAQGWYGWNNGFEEYEWSSSGRFTSPHGRGLGKSYDYTLVDRAIDNKGEYNGLDYMLLYNLYMINNKWDETPEQGYYNALSNHLTKEYNEGISNKSKPIRLVAFQDMTSEAIINEESDITYQAGERIILKTNFKVKKGAIFNAKVDKLNNCENGGRRYYKNSTDSLYSLIERTFYFKTLFDEDGERIAANLPIRVYPNPFSGHLTIEYLAAEKDISAIVRIIDPIGRCIYNKTHSTNPGTSNQIVLQTTGYINGMYFLYIETQSGRNSVKLIKQ